MAPPFRPPVRASRGGLQDAVAVCPLDPPNAPCRSLHRQSAEQAHEISGPLAPCRPYPLPPTSPRPPMDGP
ncbi:MAG: hypothetical protein EBS30_04955 [Planctomycetes bacterium]|nr:hypothetical protein [Planctomycetota bacterium]